MTGGEGSCRPRVGRLLGVLVVALLTGSVALAGCTADRPEERDEAATGSETPSVVPEDVLKQLLRDRARAIESGQREAFSATATRGPGRRAQLLWFDVLTKLPVAAVDYDVSSVVQPEGAGASRVAVRMTVRLAGDDSRPVAAAHLLQVVHRGEEWLVAEDRFAPSQLVAAPWMLEDARVRTAGNRVLLILDETSERHAPRLARLATEALAATREQVPYRWPGRVVVLAPSTTTPFRSEGFLDVEIEWLGAVVLEVEDLRDRVAAHRVAVKPDMLSEPDAALRAMLRHEFVHVAVGDRSEKLPRWLTEGLAEWAAWYGVEQLQIPSQAVTAARSGVERMPSDGEFFGDDMGRAYGIAAYALRWLADEHGARAPYDLLTAAHERKARSAKALSRLVAARYGITSDELARRGADLIVELFGP